MTREFEQWISDLNTIFWQNGRFSNLNTEYFMFLYEDDLTPEQAFDEIMTYEGY